MNSNKPRSNSFQKELKNLEINALQDVECLTALCKDCNNNIQRTLSHVSNDIEQLLRLIWREIKKK